MSRAPQPFPIALGTVKIGRNEGVKYPRSFQLPDDAQLTELLESALRLGVNLLDTAPAYGSSEERLAPFVRAHRDELLLCTKAGEEFGPGGSVYDFSAGAIRSSCERSLRRLGCDRIDFLLLHSDGDDREILDGSGAVEELYSLREEGKVGRVGISAKTDYGVRRGAELLDAVMAPLSAASPRLADSLRDAHDMGAFCMAIKTLDSGHLAEAEDRAAAVERSLEYVLACGFVDVVVLGTTRSEHLAQAVDVARRVRGGGSPA